MGGVFVDPDMCDVCFLHYNRICQLIDAVCRSLGSELGSNSRRSRAGGKGGVQTNMSHQDLAC